MRRPISTVVMLAFCTAVLRADVTITMTTTLEGGPATLAGGALTPKTTTRIKGLKARTDVEVVGQSFWTIVDLSTQQIAIVRPDQKTVEFRTASPSTDSTSAASGSGISFQPTGRSQAIDGLQCDEYSFTTTVDMAGVTGGAQLPPEGAAMMQGAAMLLKGTVWVAKAGAGVAEYATLMKAIAKANLTSALGGTGMTGDPAMSRMLTAMADLNGLTYMTDMTMSVQGTGQFADMMHQLGDLHVTSKVSTLSTDPIDDSVFVIPADYEVIKK